jgi:hypothetical protein
MKGPVSDGAFLFYDRGKRAEESKPAKEKHGPFFSLIDYEIR